MSIFGSVPPARSYDFSKPSPGRYGDAPRQRERPAVYGGKERREGPGKLPTMGKLRPIEDEPWEAQRAGAAPSAVSLTENDLSPDQKEVFAELVKWVDGGHRDTPLLTLGGYAGCLSGSTAVAYNRGNRKGVRSTTLRDLYLKFNGLHGSGRGRAQRWTVPQPTRLYSLFPDGSVALNAIVAVFESGVKSVVRLSLSDGQSLTLTADHPVATPTGEFVAAGELGAGDVVLGLGDRRNGAALGRRPLSLRPMRIIVNTKHHPRGAKKLVTCNGVTYAYMRVPRARLVVEAQMNGLSYDDYLRFLKTDEKRSEEFTYLPADVDVHHKDEDPLNDTLDNLEILPHAEHAKRHGAHENFHKEYTREVTVTEVKPHGEEMTYDVQMQSPANNFAANGVFVHNTGKTTVLGLLGKRLRRSGRRISYATFMGKASLVLKHKLQDHGAYEDNEGSSCGTLHRLMYRPITNEKTGEVEGWEPVESIESDIVVVDEASMVDEVMYEQLASYGVPILAVGDHGQLPPIRGNGFNLMGDPMLRLEKIHRQAAGNPILWLSAYVREEGHLPSRLPDDPRLKYVRPQPGWLAKNCGYDKLEDAWDSVVLAGTNDMRARINFAMRAAFGLPEGSPVAGDMLIVLKNAMFDGEQWVYNGQRAVLRERKPRNIGRAHFPATIDFLDERLRGETNLNIAQFGRAGTFKSFEELAACGHPVRSWFAAGLLADYGYALTVHKSQGSQWKHVVIMPEKMGSADDWRRWLYTATTRSADSLTIAINTA